MLKSRNIPCSTLPQLLLKLAGEDDWEKPERAKHVDRELVEKWVQRILASNFKLADRIAALVIKRSG